MYCLLFPGRLQRENSWRARLPVMRSPRRAPLARALEGAQPLLDPNTQTEENTSLGENKMPSIGNTKRLKVLQTKCIRIIKLMLRWHLCFLQRHCPTILNLTQSKQSKSPFKYFHHTVTSQAKPSQRHS